MDVTRALDAVVAISGGSSEQAVLEGLVESARGLTGALYGAAAVLLRPDGRPCAPAHQGMGPAEVAALSRLPGPVGLIATVLRGRTLRLTDMAERPRSVGSPSAHVPMAALLGVPITVSGRVLGGLYLTQPPEGGSFTAQDEHASQAACQVAGATLSAIQRVAAHEDVLEQPDVAGTRGTDPSGQETLKILARLIRLRLARDAERDADRQTSRRAFLPLLDATGRSPVLQPIVDLRTRCTVGFEALSRFAEPTGAPRAPTRSAPRPTPSAWVSGWSTRPLLVRSRCSTACQPRPACRSTCRGKPSSTRPCRTCSAPRWRTVVPADLSSSSPNTNMLRTARRCSGFRPGRPEAAQHYAQAFQPHLARLAGGR